MAKNVNTATDPKIEYQPEKTYMGIRIQTPYSGMHKAIDELRKELALWFKGKGITAVEPPLLRYHCIDMKGEMDLEYGIPVQGAHASEGPHKSSYFTRRALCKHYLHRWRVSRK